MGTQDTSYVDLTHNLTDAFNTLADEAQSLNDRRILLEHKLRFAHEQLQYLADKYAPGTTEIAETLAKLHLPPHSSVKDDASVPLPRRRSPPSQHQLALVIRDGRRVANKLASVGEASKTTDSTRYTFSETSHDPSSMSTALEQDFTVEGKKGNLQCPFSQPAATNFGAQDTMEDGHSPLEQTSQHPSDPICAGLAEDMVSQSAGANGSASGIKCPIRFMDQHSPEEIAHYVETHKHALPRNHEVCLRRYQRNEDQIRKLDAKYGNIVSMVEGLGQLHRPMLPGSDPDAPRRPSEIERASNERVQDWAKDVTVTEDAVTDEEAGQDIAEDRQSHFDRPLKEVRVGESPSRPWGIQVPVHEPSGFEDAQPPFSPPPAPVRMPSAPHSPRSTPVKARGGKCPIDHTKFAAMLNGGPPSPHMPVHETLAPSQPPEPTPFSPINEQMPHPQSPSPVAQPSFINPAMTNKGAVGNVPQMVFTGPVFIGYPMDQALQIINQYRPNNG